MSTHIVPVCHNLVAPQKEEEGPIYSGGRLKRAAYKLAADHFKVSSQWWRAGGGHLLTMGAYQFQPSYKAPNSLLCMACSTIIPAFIGVNPDLIGFSPQQPLPNNQPKQRERAVLCICKIFPLDVTKELSEAKIMYTCNSFDFGQNSTQKVNIFIR